MGPRPAVFLDRDGTILEDRGYLGDPAGARLLPGAAAAVARLNAAGLAAILVTNQSGIARGFYTEQDYRQVERRLEELLAQSGGRLDGQYFCPHLPEITGPCECRKPGGLLFRRAATDLGIDLAASWWIGDKLSDLEPSSPYGGRAILVETGEGGKHVVEARAAGFRVARDLAAAVETILSEQRRRQT